MSLAFLCAAITILPWGASKVGTMNRRVLLTLAPLLLYFSIASAQTETQPFRAVGEKLDLSQVLDRAGELTSLKTVVVAQDGEIRAESGYRGNSTKTAYNIKSASKSIISALVGIAIDKGVLEGAGPEDLAASQERLADQPRPAHRGHHDREPALDAGGAGADLRPQLWALGVKPELGPLGPGTALRRRARRRMLYSTGSTHLLSAILTRQTGRSTLELARDWLRPLDHFSIAGWERDPQGIYLGGNQMAMSPQVTAGFRGTLSQRRQNQPTASNSFRPNGSRFPGRSAPIHASPATATAMAGSCARSAATTCVTPGATAGRCSMSSRN